MTFRQLSLRPIVIDSAAFAPFGQLISPGEDGTPFSSADAQLVLSQGKPRLYIMRLHERGLSFSRITRHSKVTQCLAAMGGKEWLIAVAPPTVAVDADLMPDTSAICAFRIPGNVAIKLHCGTWHAGPYFTEPTIDFLNLELADTNEKDHLNCHLERDFGLRFSFEA